MAHFAFPCGARLVFSYPGSQKAIGWERNQPQQLLTTAVPHRRLLALTVLKRRREEACSIQLAVYAKEQASGKA